MANWKLDQGYNLDWKSQVAVEGEQEFSVEDVYVAVPFEVGSLSMEMEHEYELEVVHSVVLDLIELVPEKFRSSEILQDYFEEAGIQIGSWLTKVRDIVKLLSPNTVASIKYLRHLGALIGVDFSPEDETTETKTRKEIVHAIEWYKVKGTYQSVQIMSMIQQFTVNFYDMYSSDYGSFYMTDWFVGDEDESPPGFGASYYKTPHFGIEVLLNQVYAGDAPSVSGSTSYLWKTEYMDNLSLQIDKTRPVHTVPHYILLLNPKTDELGHVIEVDGEIKTKVLGDWEVSTKYFDMENSDETWNFDDGTYFDQSAKAFIESITKWKLGTGGSYGVTNPELENMPGEDAGVISVTITDEKIVFEFIVPKTYEQDGITELGLYVPGTPDTLVLSSIFPRIDKDDGVELRVIVEVYRSDLSPGESESGDV